MVGLVGFALRENLLLLGREEFGAELIHSRPLLFGAELALFRQLLGQPLDLLRPGNQFTKFGIPVFLSEHGRDITLEFGHRGGGGHRLAEAGQDAPGALRLGGFGFLSDGAVDSQHANDKRQFRRVEVLAQVADEMT